MKLDVSIVIPLFNEAENIQPLLAALSNFFKGNNLACEVIFVDDGSTDDSFDRIVMFTPQHFKVKIIRLSRNYGSHAALRAGIKYAKGDFVTFTYADLQDPLMLISQLYNSCQAGHDIAWAVRETKEKRKIENFLSEGYAWLMRQFVSPLYPQNGFDVVMFSSKVQKMLNTYLEANSSIFLQILTLGFKQEFINYTKQSRQRGRSKWTAGKKIKLLIDSFVAFSYAPIRMVTLVGSGMFVLGVLWTLYIIVRKWLVNDLEAGWPALISILMIGFGITNISLGIIAEYLWRTLDASRKRPVYVVDKIIELPISEVKNELFR